MNRIIWDQFGVMRQERLLPEQQELLHNKSQQNTRWKLIASYFCHQGLLHKVEATPKISGLHEDIRWRVPQPLWLLSIFIQGRVGSWLVWLVNVCLLTWASFPAEVWCCCFFLQRRMSYISATIVLRFVLAAIPLSLPYTHISLPTTCWRDMWIWITGSQFTESSESILFLSFLIKGKNRLQPFKMELI